MSPHILMFLHLPVQTQGDYALALTPWSDLLVLVQSRADGITCIGNSNPVPDTSRGILLFLLDKLWGPLVVPPRLVLHSRDHCPPHPIPLNPGYLKPRYRHPRPTATTSKTRTTKSGKDGLILFATPRKRARI